MLRFLSRVKIEFNAKDPKTASCMEFLAQCRALESKKSNPRCQIEVKRRTDEAPPKIAVTFVNGVDQVFDPVITPAQTIRSAILEKSEVVKTEQMFLEAREKWPVLIPEAELRTPFKGVKVTDVGKEGVKGGKNMVTLHIKMKSFGHIPDEWVSGFM